MSKKLPIYFSDPAFANLQNMMGQEGKPSPTINAILESLGSPSLQDFGFKTVVSSTTTFTIPIPLESIPAGFPSPASDYIDDCVDLNRLLVSNPNATFLNRIKTLSMLDAGLEMNDVVVIDRSIEPKHRSIVVALIDGKDLTIKRLMITSLMTHEELVETFGEDYQQKQLPKSWLKAENPEFQSIFPSSEQTIQIEAVITWNLRNMINH
ncbi:LexA family protein [Acinetobacter ursingii]|uniref:LexA family protein n=1 Tax=Acinetobacter ursingii TaxID=108980 RepID=UPI00124F7BCF|nr:translesion error-prone DNA polymerase V autoproteolytic subunit [Acinetobacter ursingii]MCU4483653.1 translesion error-prone DNA polymerase V autoproteolytic subunit [Acinetobacter ursingii]MCU4507973.1 translesion error-prone DNA polymerase V autoproteolytic subunit [Acinetobacter ursingii]